MSGKGERGRESNKRWGRGRATRGGEEGERGRERKKSVEMWR